MTDKPTPGGVVGDYRRKIKERQEAARRERPSIGNLADADAMYDPKADGPVTIASLTNAHERIQEPDPNAKPTLSQETVAGMQALFTAAQQQKESMPEPQSPPPPPAAATAPMPMPVEEAPEEEHIQDVKRKVAADAISGLDDLEFERLMSGIQTDVLNNREQREAVEKLVGKFDLAKGLATGNWEQRVPIVPGTLDVRFRLVSSYENQSIRLLLFDWCEEDPRREAISPEIYSMMMVVASIVQINDSRLPQHLTGTEAYKQEFDPKAFSLKYNMILQYPLPLIHAFGVHSGWFDQRVREALKVTALKPG